MASLINQSKFLAPHPDVTKLEAESNLIDDSIQNIDGTLGKSSLLQVSFQPESTVKS